MSIQEKGMTEGGNQTRLKTSNLKRHQRARLQPQSTSLSPLPTPSIEVSLTMASSKPVARLVAYRGPSPFLLSSRQPLRQSTFVPVARFSQSAVQSATPSGPPPAGFRLPPQKRWDQGDESSLDKASKYFLLAEMFRGMYVVLEQFFRPP